MSMLTSPSPWQLLLDWELEDMLATELLHRLKPRESGHLQRLPIFIVSGDDHSDELDALRVHGVQACWVKPVSADHLQTIIDDHAAAGASEGAGDSEAAAQSLPTLAPPDPP